jgi:hypothetical protein
MTIKIMYSLPTRYHAKALYYKKKAIHHQATVHKRTLVIMAGCRRSCLSVADSYAITDIQKVQEQALLFSNSFRSDKNKIRLWNTQTKKAFGYDGIPGCNY